MTNEQQETASKYTYQKADIEEALSHCENIPLGAGQYVEHSDQSHIYAQRPLSISEIVVEPPNAFMRDTLLYCLKAGLDNVKRRRLAWPVMMNDGNHWAVLALTLDSVDDHVMSDLRAKLSEGNSQNTNHQSLEQKLEASLRDRTVIQHLQNLYQKVEAVLYDTNYNQNSATDQQKQRINQALSNAYQAYQQPALSEYNPLVAAQKDPGMITVRLIKLYLHNQPIQLGSSQNEQKDVLEALHLQYMSQCPKLRGHTKAAQNGDEHVVDINANNSYTFFSTTTQTDHFNNRLNYFMNNNNGLVKGFRNYVKTRKSLDDLYDEYYNAVEGDNSLTREQKDEKESTFTESYQKTLRVISENFIKAMPEVSKKIALERCYQKYKTYADKSSRYARIAKILAPSGGSLLLASEIGQTLSFGFCSMKEDREQCKDISSLTSQSLIYFLVLTLMPTIGYLTYQSQTYNQKAKNLVKEIEAIEQNHTYTSAAQQYLIEGTEPQQSSNQQGDEVSNFQKAMNKLNIG